LVVTAGTVTNNVANQEKEVVHLHFAAPNVLVVVGSIRFPVVTLNTPNWKTAKVT
jgi:hypothetical protein